MTDVVILGAGIAGITAAYFAHKNGLRATIFERENRAGGLLDNFTIEGFRFDNAVHLSFASEREVREIFDQTPYITHPADSRCFDNGIWLKHPVQNNLFNLPVETRVKLLKGFIDRPEIQVKNYEDWLVHQYGKEIAEKYPLPYTEKYWTVPAAQLNTSWIGNRMRRAELTEVLHGAITSETPNTYYVKEMRYPKLGGYRAFVEPMISKLKIELGHKVVAIDLENRKVFFDTGACKAFTHLVSSLPLPVLTELIVDAPDFLKHAGNELLWTSIDLISIGIRGKNKIKDLWAYIYDNDIMAARFHSPSLKSPTNCPDGFSSIQFEIYSSRLKPQSHSTQELVENCKYALKKMHICDPEDICLMHHKKIEFGNVVFNHGMEEHREVIRSYLKTRNVIPIGRFGEWDYLWSNQAFMSGKKAIDSIT